MIRYRVSSQEESFMDVKLKFKLTNDSFNGQALLESSIPKWESVKLDGTYVITAYPTAHLSIKRNDNTMEKKDEIDIKIKFDDLFPTIFLSTTFFGYEKIIIKDQMKKTSDNSNIYEIRVLKNKKEWLNWTLKYKERDAFNLNKFAFTSSLVGEYLETPLELSVNWDMKTRINVYSFNALVTKDATNVSLSMIVDIEKHSFEIILETPFKNYEKISLIGKTGTTSIGKSMGIQFGHNRSKREISMESMMDEDGVENYSINTPFEDLKKMSLRVKRDNEGPFQFGFKSQGKLLLALGIKYDLRNPLKALELTSQVIIPMLKHEENEFNLNFKANLNKEGLLEIKSPVRNFFLKHKYAQSSDGINEHETSLKYNDKKNIFELSRKESSYYRENEIYSKEELVYKTNFLGKKVEEKNSMSEYKITFFDKSAFKFEYKTEDSRFDYAFTVGLDFKKLSEWKGDIYMKTGEHPESLSGSLELKNNEIHGVLKATEAEILTVNGEFKEDFVSFKLVSKDFDSNTQVTWKRISDSNGSFKNEIKINSVTDGILYETFGTFDSFPFKNLDLTMKYRGEIYENIHVSHDISDSDGTFNVDLKKYKVTINGNYKIHASDWLFSLKGIQKQEFFSIQAEKKDKIDIGIKFDDSTFTSGDSNSNKFEIKFKLSKTNIFFEASMSEDNEDILKIFAKADFVIKDKYFLVSGEAGMSDEASKFKIELDWNKQNPKLFVNASLDSLKLFELSATSKGFLDFLEVKILCMEQNIEFSITKSNDSSNFIVYDVNLDFLGQNILKSSIKYTPGFKNIHSKFVMKKEFVEVKARNEGSDMSLVITSSYLSDDFKIQYNLGSSTFELLYPQYLEIHGSVKSERDVIMAEFKVKQKIVNAMSNTNGKMKIDGYKDLKFELNFDAEKIKYSHQLSDLSSKELKFMAHIVTTFQLAKKVEVGLSSGPGKFTLKLKRNDREYSIKYANDNFQKFLLSIATPLHNFEKLDIKFAQKDGNISTKIIFGNLVDVTVMGLIKKQNGKLELNGVLLGKNFDLNIMLKNGKSLEFDGHIKDANGNEVMKAKGTGTFSEKDGDFQIHIGSSNTLKGSWEYSSDGIKLSYSSTGDWLTERFGEIDFKKDGPGGFVGDIKSNIGNVVVKLNSLSSGFDVDINVSKRSNQNIFIGRITFKNSGGSLKLDAHVSSPLFQHWGKEISFHFDSLSLDTSHIDISLKGRLFNEEHFMKFSYKFKNPKEMEGNIAIKTMLLPINDIKAPFSFKMTHNEFNALFLNNHVFVKKSSKSHLEVDMHLDLTAIGLEKYSFNLEENYPNALSMGLNFSPYVQFKGNYSISSQSELRSEFHVESFAFPHTLVSLSMDYMEKGTLKLSVSNEDGPILGFNTMKNGNVQGFVSNDNFGTYSMDLDGNLLAFKDSSGDLHSLSYSNDGEYSLYVSSPFVSSSPRSKRSLGGSYSVDENKNLKLSVQTPFEALESMNMEFMSDGPAQKTFSFESKGNDVDFGFGASFDFENPNSLVQVHLLFGDYRFKPSLIKFDLDVNIHKLSLSYSYGDIYSFELLGEHIPSKGLRVLKVKATESARQLVDASAQLILNAGSIDYEGKYSFALPEYKKRNIKQIFSLFEPLSNGGGHLKLDWFVDEFKPKKVIEGDVTFASKEGNFLMKVLGKKSNGKYKLTDKDLSITFDIPDNKPMNLKFEWAHGSNQHYVYKISMKSNFELDFSIDATLNKHLTASVFLKSPTMTIGTVNLKLTLHSKHTDSDWNVEGKLTHPDLSGSVLGKMNQNNLLFDIQANPSWYPPQKITIDLKRKNQIYNGNIEMDILDNNFKPVTLKAELNAAEKNKYHLSLNSSVLGVQYQLHSDIKLTIEESDFNIKGLKNGENCIRLESKESSIIDGKDGSLYHSKLEIPHSSATKYQSINIAIKKQNEFSYPELRGAIELILSADNNEYAKVKLNRNPGSTSLTMSSPLLKDNKELIVRIEHDTKKSMSIEYGSLIKFVSKLVFKNNVLLLESKLENQLQKPNLVVSKIQINLDTKTIKALVDLGKDNIKVKGEVKKLGESTDFGFAMESTFPSLKVISFHGSYIKKSPSESKISLKANFNQQKFLLEAEHVKNKKTILSVDTPFLGYQHNQFEILFENNKAELHTRIGEGVNEIKVGSHFSLNLPRIAFDLDVYTHAEKAVHIEFEIEMGQNEKSFHLEVGAVGKEMKLRIEFEDDEHVEVEMHLPIKGFENLEMNLKLISMTGDNKEFEGKFTTGSKQYSLHSKMMSKQNKNTKLDIKLKSLDGGNYFADLHLDIKHENLAQGLDADFSLSSSFMDPAKGNVHYKLNNRYFEGKAKLSYAPLPHMEVVYKLGIDEDKTFVAEAKAIGKKTYFDIAFSFKFEGNLQFTSKVSIPSFFKGFELDFVIVDDRKKSEATFVLDFEGIRNELSLALQKPSPGNLILKSVLVMNNENIMNMTLHRQRSLELSYPPTHTKNPSKGFYILSIHSYVKVPKILSSKSNSPDLKFELFFNNKVGAKVFASSNILGEVQSALFYENEIARGKAGFEIYQSNYKKSASFHADFKPKGKFEFTLFNNKNSVNLLLEEEAGHLKLNRGKRETSFEWNKNDLRSGVASLSTDAGVHRVQYSISPDYVGDVSVESPYLPSGKLQLFSKISKNLEKPSAKSMGIQFGHDNSKREISMESMMDEDGVENYSINTPFEDLKKMSLRVKRDNEGPFQFGFKSQGKLLLALGIKYDLRNPLKALELTSQVIIPMLKHEENEFNLNFKANLNKEGLLEIKSPVRNFFLKHKYAQSSDGINEHETSLKYNDKKNIFELSRKESSYYRENEIYSKEELVYKTNFLGKKVEEKNSMSEYKITFFDKSAFKFEYKTEDSRFDYAFTVGLDFKKLSEWKGDIYMKTGEHPESLSGSLELKNNEIHGVLKATEAEILTVNGEFKEDFVSFKLVSKDFDSNTQVTWKRISDSNGSFKNEIKINSVTDGILYETFGTFDSFPFKNLDLTMKYRGEIYENIHVSHDISDSDGTFNVDLKKSKVTINGNYKIHASDWLFSLKGIQKQEFFSIQAEKKDKIDIGIKFDDSTFTSGDSNSNKFEIKFKLSKTNIFFEASMSEDNEDILKIFAKADFVIKDKYFLVSGEAGMSDEASKFKIELDWNKQNPKLFVNASLDSLKLFELSATSKGFLDFLEVKILCMEQNIEFSITKSNDSSNFIVYDVNLDFLGQNILKSSIKYTPGFKNIHSKFVMKKEFVEVKARNEGSDMSLVVTSSYLSDDFKIQYNLGSSTFELLYPQYLEIHGSVKSERDVIMAEFKVKQKIVNAMSNTNGKMKIDGYKDLKFELNFDAEKIKYSHQLSDLSSKELKFMAHIVTTFQLAKKVEVGLSSGPGKFTLKLKRNDREYSIKYANDNFQKFLLSIATPLHNFEKLDIKFAQKDGNISTKIIFGNLVDVTVMGLIKKQNGKLELNGVLLGKNFDLNIMLKNGKSLEFDGHIKDANGNEVMKAKGTGTFSEKDGDFQIHIGSSNTLKGSWEYSSDGIKLSYSSTGDWLTERFGEIDFKKDGPGGFVGDIKSNIGNVVVKLNSLSSGFDVDINVSKRSNQNIFIGRITFKNSGGSLKLDAHVSSPLFQHWGKEISFHFDSLSLDTSHIDISLKGRLFNEEHFMKFSYKFKNPKEMEGNIAIKTMLLPINDIKAPFSFKMTHNEFNALFLNNHVFVKKSSKSHLEVDMHLDLTAIGLEKYSFNLEENYPNALSMGLNFSPYVQFKGNYSISSQSELRSEFHVESFAFPHTLVSLSMDYMEKGTLKLSVSNEDGPILGFNTMKNGNVQGFVSNDNFGTYSMDLDGNLLAFKDSSGDLHSLSYSNDGEYSLYVSSPFVSSSPRSKRSLGGSYSVDENKTLKLSVQTPFEALESMNMEFMSDGPAQKTFSFESKGNDVDFGFGASFDFENPNSLVQVHLLFGDYRVEQDGKKGQAFNFNLDYENYKLKADSSLQGVFSFDIESEYIPDKLKFTFKSVGKGESGKFIEFNTEVNWSHFVLNYHGILTHNFFGYKRVFDENLVIHYGEEKSSIFYKEGNVKIKVLDQDAKGTYVLNENDAQITLHLPDEKDFELNFAWMLSQKSVIPVPLKLEILAHKLGHFSFSLLQWKSLNISIDAFDVVKQDLIIEFEVSEDKHLIANMEGKINGQIEIKLKSTEGGYNLEGKFNNDWRLIFDFVFIEKSKLLLDFLLHLPISRTVHLRLLFLRPSILLQKKSLSPGLPPTYYTDFDFHFDKSRYSLDANFNIHAKKSEFFLKLSKDDKSMFVFKGKRDALDFINYELFRNEEKQASFHHEKLSSTKEEDTIKMKTILDIPPFGYISSGPHFLILNTELRFKKLSKGYDLSLECSFKMDDRDLGKGTIKLDGLENFKIGFIPTSSDGEIFNLFVQQLGDTVLLDVKYDSLLIAKMKIKNNPGMLAIDGQLESSLSKNGKAILKVAINKDKKTFKALYEKMDSQIKLKGGIKKLNMNESLGKKTNNGEGTRKGDIKVVVNNDEYRIDSELNAKKRLLLHVSAPYAGFETNEFELLFLTDSKTELHTRIGTDENEIKIGSHLHFDVSHLAFDFEVHTQTEKAIHLEFEVQMSDDEKSVHLEAGAVEIHLPIQGFQNIEMDVKLISMTEDSKEFEGKFNTEGKKYTLRTKMVHNQNEHAELDVQLKSLDENPLELEMHYTLQARYFEGTIKTNINDDPIELSLKVGQRESQKSYVFVSKAVVTNVLYDVSSSIQVEDNFQVQTKISIPTYLEKLFEAVAVIKTQKKDFDLTFSLNMENKMNAVSFRYKISDDGEMEGRIIIKVSQIANLEIPFGGQFKSGPNSSLISGHVYDNNFKVKFDNHHYVYDVEIDLNATPSTLDYFGGSENIQLKINFDKETGLKILFFTSKDGKFETNVSWINQIISGTLFIDAREIQFVKRLNFMMDLRPKGKFEISLMHGDSGIEMTMQGDDARILTRRNKRDIFGIELRKTNTDWLSSGILVFMTGNGIHKASYSLSPASTGIFSFESPYLSHGHVTVHVNYNDEYSGRLSYGPISISVSALNYIKGLEQSWAFEMNYQSLDYQFSTLSLSLKGNENNDDFSLNMALETNGESHELWMTLPKTLYFDREFNIQMKSGLFGNIMISTLLKSFFVLEYNGNQVDLKWSLNELTASGSLFIYGIQIKSEILRGSKKDWWSIKTQTNFDRFAELSLKVFNINGKDFNFEAITPFKNYEFIQGNHSLSTESAHLTINSFAGKYEVDFEYYNNSINVRLNGPNFQTARANIVYEGLGTPQIHFKAILKSNIMYLKDTEIDIVLDIKEILQSGVKGLIRYGDDLINIDVSYNLYQLLIDAEITTTFTFSRRFEIKTGYDWGDRKRLKLYTNIPNLKLGFQFEYFIQSYTNFSILYEFQTNNLIVNYSPIKKLMVYVQEFQPFSSVKDFKRTGISLDLLTRLEYSSNQIMEFFFKNNGFDAVKSKWFRSRDQNKVMVIAEGEFKKKNGVLELLLNQNSKRFLHLKWNPDFNAITFKEVSFFNLSFDVAFTQNFDGFDGKFSFGNDYACQLNIRPNSLLFNWEEASGNGILVSYKFNGLMDFHFAFSQGSQELFRVESLFKEHIKVYSIIISMSKGHLKHTVSMDDSSFGISLFWEDNRDLPDYKFGEMSITIFKELETKKIKIEHKGNDIWDDFEAFIIHKRSHKTLGIKFKNTYEPTENLKLEINLLLEDVGHFSIETQNGHTKKDFHVKFSFLSKKTMSMSRINVLSPEASYELLSTTHLLEDGRHRTDFIITKFEDKLVSLQMEVQPYNLILIHELFIMNNDPLNATIGLLDDKKVVFDLSMSGSLSDLNLRDSFFNIPYHQIDFDTHYVRDFGHALKQRWIGFFEESLDQILYATKPVGVKDLYETFKHTCQRIPNEKMRSFTLKQLNYIESLCKTWIRDFDIIAESLKDIAIDFNKAVIELIEVGVVNISYEFPKFVISSFQKIHFASYFQSLKSFLGKSIHITNKYIQVYKAWLNGTWKEVQTLFKDMSKGIQEDLSDTLIFLRRLGIVEEILNLYLDYRSWLEEIEFSGRIKELYGDLKRYVNIISYQITKFQTIYEKWTSTIYSYVRKTVSSIENNFPVIGYIVSNFGHAVRRVIGPNIVELNPGQIIGSLTGRIEILASILSNLANIDDFLLHSFTYDNRSFKLTQNLPFTWKSFKKTPEIIDFLLGRDQEKVNRNMMILQNTIIETSQAIRNILSTDPYSLIPPFSSSALIIGNGGIMTFDKKRYEIFPQTCSYILISDFLYGRFEVIVNYVNGRRTSLTVYTENNEININTLSFEKVTLNGRTVELPLTLGANSFISQISEKRILLRNNKGFKIECNGEYDYCSTTVSGWYFARVGGLFGVYDNEPANDWMKRNRQVSKDGKGFMNSWSSGPKCHGHDVLIDMKKQPTNGSVEDEQCWNLFHSSTSALFPCFEYVETTPYHDLCVHSMRKYKNSIDKTRGYCPSASAYAIHCKNKGIALWIPSSCSTCLTAEDAQIMQVGESSRIVQKTSQRNYGADIVFLIDIGQKCNPLLFKNLPNLLESSLTSLNITQNRYSIVGYGGKNDLNIPIPYTSSVHNALISLKSNGIVAHRLVPGEFCIKNKDYCKTKKGILGYNRDSVIFSWDNSNKSLRRFLKMNKDYISTLAVESGGIVFDSNSFKKQDLNHFASRVAESAHPQECQVCDCLSNSDGLGTLKCHPCIEPIINQLINNILQSH
ncbi:unnamed protein product [Lepeophtheirus salmonis]|uniref:(salmon louse) hypothetical protein n=1 Tax=Lepeophtheirus salmonis TaxID=72036 RepID=A0A7R8CV63_LEPSM|nr:unnamed protein product [Lepeophtheirus salmonis]CAF2942571.1 unnamed protein product [Lepeophtheirus salmonis]